MWWISMVSALGKPCQTHEDEKKHISQILTVHTHPTPKIPERLKMMKSQMPIGINTYS